MVETSVLWKGDSGAVVIMVRSSAAKTTPAPRSTTRWRWLWRTVRPIANTRSEPTTLPSATNTPASPAALVAIPPKAAVLAMHVAYTLVRAVKTP